MAWVHVHQGMLNPSHSNLESYIWALVWSLRTCLFPRQWYTKWSHPSCGMLCLKSKLKSNVISKVFPVVMYGSESWTIKKAERQRIDAFELWCWRRLLRVPWTARRSNQSILKEINPEYSLEGLMLKLKLQYFGPLMRRANSFGKDSDAGKDWRQEEKGMTEDKMVGWHHWLNGHKFEQVLGDGEGQGSLVYCNPWGLKESDTTEWLNNKIGFQEPLYSC